MSKKRHSPPTPSTSNPSPRDEEMRDDSVPSTSGENETFVSLTDRIFSFTSRIPPIPDDFPPPKSDGAGASSERPGDSSGGTSSFTSTTPDDRTTDDSLETGSTAGSTNSSGRSRNYSRRRRPARTIYEACRTLPNSLPVKGESYCDCPKQGRDLKCTCGEEDDVFDWTWDTQQIHSACEVMEDGQTVIFHKNYSSGTAIARGTEKMVDRQYFWEVKMTSPVYGTDMMVGVGTENVNLGAFRHAFTSMIGRDGESWGLSYYGRIQHKGEFQDVGGAKFGQGTILGVHVDMWHGTVSYYKNRQPLGVAYSGLAGKTLYPMVASTAARTAMKVIKACSFQTSLQFLCCQVLRKLVPSDLSVISALQFPPGLRAFLENNLSWLLRPCELSQGHPASMVSPPAINRKRNWTDSDSSEESETGSTSEDELLDRPSARTNPPQPKRSKRSSHHAST